MDKAIYRNLYRAAIKGEMVECFKAKLEQNAPAVKKLIEEGKLYGVSVFNYKQNVFAYIESLDEPCCPCCIFDDAANELLEDWPGAEKPRKWVKLIDVFHFNAPDGLSTWERKTPVEKHLGKIGVLKPECIQRYCFYHYALQEERAVEGSYAFDGSKYQNLGINENVVFCYDEAPSVVEPPVLPSATNTHVVPQNWADAGISPCFIPWEDKVGTSEERLRLMDELVSIW